MYRYNAASQAEAAMRLVRRHVSDAELRRARGGEATVVGEAVHILKVQLA